MKELTTREIQTYAVKILLEFDKICRENNLKYSLGYGTLLGAIRHKGFIPWDDDIDVIMPRPDYEKFIAIYKQQGAGSKYQMVENCGKSADPVLRLHDPDIDVIEREYNVRRKLWLDIFPVDGMPDSVDETIKLFKKVRRNRTVVVFSTVYNSKKYTGYDKKAYLKYIYSKLYRTGRAHKNIEKLCKKYKYESSTYAGVIDGIFSIGERRLREEYESLVEVEFEGNKLLALKNWDEYLTSLYGDYMTLPPVDKRRTHYLKAFMSEK